MSRPDQPALASAAAATAEIVAISTLAPAGSRASRRCLCPACAYDLSPTLAEQARVCPECGGEFELHQLVERQPMGAAMRRSAVVLAALSILLIGAADLFFYRQPVGCTVALFFTLVLVGVTAREHAYLRRWHGRLALVALLGMMLSLIEHPGPLRVAMAFLAIASIATLNRQRWTTSATAWIARWMETFARTFAQLPLDLVTANRWTRAHGGRGARRLRELANWTIPVLLSLVFIALFSAANPLIARWLRGAGDAVSRVFSDFFEFVRYDRMLLWLGFGLLSWALLRGRWRWKLSRRGVAEQAAETPVQALLPPGVNIPALLVRCLVLFNIVFAVQMTIDLAMVLSNGALLPDGMTWSSYARRGAYPLVATALLAAAFVLVTFPSGSQSAESARASRTMRWARALVCLWIAQNIILTISAGWRLQMYVEVFSLTRLRVAAGVWMMLVAIGLATIIWRIVAHRTNTWLVRANMVSLLATLYLCCFINFDSMIAWYDVRHCQESGVADGPHLDRRYLRGLGPEAIEPLEWLLQRTDDERFATLLHGDISMLKSDLQDDLRTWQGWTLRRHWIASRTQ